MRDFRPRLATAPVPVDRNHHLSPYSPAGTEAGAPPPPTDPRDHGFEDWTLNSTEGPTRTTRLSSSASPPRLPSPFPWKDRLKDG